MSLLSCFNRRSIFARAVALLGLCLSLPVAGVADPVPCASLGFDPSEEGGGILERFFVETDGVGGLGCWMHPHPNGKDAIFTPFSWGRVPNPGKQGLIDDAMAAITETSDYLRRHGTVDNELYVLLTDLVREDWQAEALWIENDRCWMEITPRAGWGAFGPSLRPEFKSTIAHEIGHCFFMENFEDYNEEGTEFASWWDESGANYIMAQVYPAENIEHYDAGNFDLDQSDFFQPYNAVVLLQHYTNSHNDAKVHQFLRTAWAQGRTYQDYIAYLDSAAIDEFFHAFNVRHFYGTVLDPGGGNMPRESDVQSVAEHRLKDDFGTIDVDRIKPHRLVRVELTLPMGQSVSIDGPEDVNRTFHASLLANGQAHNDWVSGIEIEGWCDVDTDVRLILTTLRRDGVESAAFPYQTRRNASCDCEEYDSLDGCLVGSWEMDPASRGLLFGEDGPVGGRVGLTFGPSGAFVYNFSNLTFHGVSYTKSGKLNMEILKTYDGTVRGCATTAPQGQRLDGAIPMETDVVADGVRRSTTIRHGGVGTTTAKTEDGLEAWFWPNKPTYYRCEGDTLRLERRVFHRTSD